MYSLATKVCRCKKEEIVNLNNLKEKLSDLFTESYVEDNMAYGEETEFDKSLNKIKKKHKIKSDIVSVETIIDLIIELVEEHTKYDEDYFKDYSISIEVFEEEIVVFVAYLVQ